jgi:hypothetical protein
MPLINLTIFITVIMHKGVEKVNSYCMNTVLYITWYCMDCDSYSPTVIGIMSVI